MRQASKCSSVRYTGTTTEIIGLRGPSATRPERRTEVPSLTMRSLRVRAGRRRMVTIHRSMGRSGFLSDYDQLRCNTGATATPRSSWA